MAFLRAFSFAGALAFYFVVIGALQNFLTRRYPSAARWLSIVFCRSLLRILRVSVEVRGCVADGSPVLLAANHISWIDVLALGSVMPFCFLAKSEVASWPILSKFTTVQGTVFVDRSRRRNILAVNRTMAGRMLAGRKVLLFPEGTTLGAVEPGPFLSSHFAAARDLLRLAPAVPVVVLQPVALGYSSARAAWIDDEALVPHVWRVLRGAPMRCTIVFGAPLPFPRPADRKAMARAARGAIVAMLAALRARPGAAPEHGCCSRRGRGRSRQLLGPPMSGDLEVVSAILEAMPEAVLAVGPDDRILEINAAGRALFPAGRPGLPLARILRSPDILDAVEQVRASGGSGRVSWLERVPVERLFEVHVAAAGAALQPMLILCFHEISETRRFERMRVDFVANASHELRTPLASLLGFIETLQGPARNDPAAGIRFLAIMREQAQRMARLVDDLLSLSRIEQHLHLRPAHAPSTSSLCCAISPTRWPPWPRIAASTCSSTCPSRSSSAATATNSCAWPRTSSRTP